MAVHEKLRHHVCSGLYLWTSFGILRSCMALHYACRNHLELTCSQIVFNCVNYNHKMKVRWKMSARDPAKIEQRPLVISACGSLDLVDLHGWEAWLVPSGTSQGAAVAPATTQFHWRQDPSLSTECSRCEKPSTCFSVLGVAGSSPGRTSHPSTCLRSPKVSALIESALARSIVSGHKQKWTTSNFEKSREFKWMRR